MSYEIYAYIGKPVGSNPTTLLVMASINLCAVSLDSIFYNLTKRNATDEVTVRVPKILHPSVSSEHIPKDPNQVVLNRALSDYIEYDLYGKPLVSIPLRDALRAVRGGIKRGIERYGNPFSRLVMFERMLRVAGPSSDNIIVVTAGH